MFWVVSDVVSIIHSKSKAPADVLVLVAPVARISKSSAAPRMTSARVTGKLC